MLERDEAIVSFIARYKLATVPTLSTEFFGDLTQKAAERVIARLIDQDQLRSWPLVGRSRYYTLAPAAARRLGLDESRVTRPMGTQALIQNLAILLFCVAGQVKRKRMTAEEFSTRFPNLARPGMARNRYYLDRDAESGVTRLALMVADFDADPRRLARKVRKEFHRRTEIEAFRPLIKEKRFLVSLLTAFSPKAQRLSEFLAQEPFPVRVHCVQGVRDLFVRKTTDDPTPVEEAIQPTES